MGQIWAVPKLSFWFNLFFSSVRNKVGDLIREFPRLNKPWLIFDFQLRSLLLNWLHHLGLSASLVFVPLASFILVGCSLSAADPNLNSQRKMTKNQKRDKIENILELFPIFCYLDISFSNGWHIFWEISKQNIKEWP